MPTDQATISQNLLLRRFSSLEIFLGSGCCRARFGINPPTEKTSDFLSLSLASPIIIQRSGSGHTREREREGERERERERERGINGRFSLSLSLVGSHVCTHAFVFTCTLQVSEEKPTNRLISSSLLVLPPPLCGEEQGK